MNNLTTKNRIEWIDICKAIAIYIMVFGHVGVPRKIDIIIHAFHMPVFFILSGYCFNELKNNDILKYIKKSFFKLIVPYFIFGISLYILWDLILYIFNRKEEILSINNLISHLIFNTKSGSFGVIQWFLTCLFFTQISFCIICKTINKNSIKFCILIVYSIIAFLYPIFFKKRLPFSLDCYFMAIFFFGVGWFLRLIDINKFINIVKSHIITTFSILVFVAIAVLPLIFLNGYVNMCNIVYGNYFLFIFNAIVYSLLLIVFSIFLDIAINQGIIKKILLWIGKNTIVILLLNQFLRQFLNIFLNKFIFVQGIKLYFINIFISFFIVFLSTIISELIKKYIPYVLGEFKHNI